MYARNLRQQKYGVELLYLVAILNGFMEANFDSRCHSKIVFSYFKYTQERMRLLIYSNLLHRSNYMHALRAYKHSNKLVTQSKPASYET